MSANALSVKEAAQAIREGSLRSEELVRACLDRIVEHEDTVGAWAHVDPEFALAQARAADEAHAAGRDTGPLHGVPVGIKDIIDTADLRTERGTDLYKGRRPEKDATLVSALRQAGAVILGKTVTTEMAVYSPGKTRNPHDLSRTPGGSSSGSAAAVAAYMVPGAVGTQTNGSMIRPASFCGVYGYKPTHGLISRTGALVQSPSLDTIGVFARTVDDLALLAEPMMVFDDRDPDMTPTQWPHLIERVAEEPVGTPRFLFVRSPVWEQAEDSAKDAFRELVEHVSEVQGDVLELFELPLGFEKAHEVHRVIMEADIARNYAREYADGKDRLSALLVAMIERGQKIGTDEYDDARAMAEELKGGFANLFDDYDGLLTPATAGEAPVGLDSTGSPAFCTIWSLLGMPAVSLPLLQGENSMPLGVQMVSYRGDDARLLRTAKWLAGTLEDN